MATYEYNSSSDQLDVTTGQAFTNENHITHRRINSKRTIHQISETTRIQEVSGMFKVQYFQDDSWQYHMVEIAAGHPQAWWTFSYDEALTMAQTLIESATPFVYIYSHQGLVQESYVLYTMKGLDSKPEHHMFGEYPATSNPKEVLKKAVDFRKQGYRIRPGYEQEYQYIQQQAMKG